MRHQIAYLCLLLTTFFVSYVNSEGCLIEERPEELCPETEYQAYIECLQTKKRMKRSVCNSEPCNECNCSYCEKNECSEMCNNCCEISFDTCETSYCCYKKCHTKCNSGECRRNCRKSCQDTISEKRKVVVEQQESAQSPNITTVINLHNQINNTNILDIPIKIETKNVNNITLEAPDMNVQSDQGVVEAHEENVKNPEDSKIDENIKNNNPDVNIEVTTENNQEDKNNCCQIISPRQCVPQTQFPFIKCFHYRQQVCGSICQAKIMHTQTHQICDENPSGPPECHNQIIYIPQPQPRCTYLDIWPYVTCNVQNMDVSYNVGPFGQYPYAQYPYTQYPYGQYPNQLSSYQNTGYNFNQYNTQPYPLLGMQNLYSVAKNVDENNSNYENMFDRKEVVDFSEGNYLSETIPIEIDQLKGEHINPELVRIEVESKPYQTDKNKNENETIL